MFSKTTDTTLQSQAWGSPLVRPSVSRQGFRQSYNLSSGIVGFKRSADRQRLSYFDEYIIVGGVAPGGRTLVLPVVKPFF